VLLGRTLLGPWEIVLHGGPDPPTDRGRGLSFKFLDPLISPEWLKLEA